MTRPVRLAVTGGRDYADEAAVAHYLGRVLAVRGIAMLIHGGARGADTLAANWAEANGVVTERHDADWRAHGRAAGPLRNGRMVASGIDVLLAFPGGRGTADMVRQARAAGVKIWMVGKG